MRRRFPWLPFFILAALLVFSSCDSSEADTSCEALDLNAKGFFTATLDGDRYEANCFLVEMNDGLLFVTGFRTSLSEYLLLGVGGTEERTYQLDVTEERSLADYSRLSDGVSYTVGTITIDLFSSSRVRGTFNVSTEDGDLGAVGEFDVYY